jgi:crotonobetainyl-CoA:carnitine CoA-transferase CaiB-like acyl-CoA transferase
MAAILGPFAAQTLDDLGADVLEIESAEDANRDAWTRDLRP